MLQGSLLSHAPLVLAAGGALDPLVRDLGLAFILAGVLGVVFTRLRIPSIAAFIAAGLLLGPEVGGVVTSEKSIETISSLGLTLLLFVIGLEIDVKKVLASGRVLLLTGLLQVPLSVLMGLGLARLLGAAGIPGLSTGQTPLYVGLAAAFSSTLIVVKLFVERFQFDTVVGRISVGLLIFQDIWAIVILAIQPDLADPRLGPVALTLLGIVFVIAAAVLVARFVLPAAFRWIAKTPELMLVAAVAWCFGLGAFGYNLGAMLHAVGIDLPLQVSMEMGALIAGASIASLPFAHEVVSKVGVVRDFFVTLFFVGLGLAIPLPRDGSVLIVALVVIAIALLVRLVVYFGLLYVSGLDRRNSMVVSVKLAQVSEFCLVIVYLGQSYGHVSSTFVGGVIFAFVATAIATPFTFDLGDRIHEALGPLLGRLGLRAPAAAGPEEGREEGYDLALLGFHRVASSLLEELRRQRPDLLARVLVVDFNVALHSRIRALGPTVRYGDIANLESLRHLGVDRAKVVMSTVHDDVLKGTSNLRLARMIRELAPSAQVVVNAVDLPSARAMYQAGADYVFLYRLETAKALVPALEAALSDGIAAYREARVAREGGFADREEVLP